MPTTETRTNNQMSQYAERREVTTWLGNPWQDTGWFVSNNYGSLVDMGDAYTTRRETQSNPNWKVQVKKRQNASTPYYRREVISTPATGRVRLQVLIDGYPQSTRMYGIESVTWPPRTPVLSLQYEDADLADLAITRLKRKLSNRTQSFNSIIPLAELRELRQTVDGMATTTMKVLVALSDVKRSFKRTVRNVKDPAKLRKALKSAYKDASNIWLTYSFGVSPMMSTIKDVSQSIGDYLVRYDSIDRLTGSATKAWTTPEYRSDQSVSAVQGAYLETYTSCRHKLQYKYIAGHRFSLTSANDYGAVDHFGLSPPNLIPAIWELTAFSWVVDYFTTVGAYLDDTFSGNTGESVYVIKNRKYSIEASTRVQYNKTYTGSGYQYLEWDTNAVAGSVAAYDFRREVLNSYPPRVLRFKTLDEVGLNGVSKLLNLASVLSKSF